MAIEVREVSDGGLLDLAGAGE
jgi:hypothetical protein